MGGGQPLPLDNSTNMNLSIKIMVGGLGGGPKRENKNLNNHQHGRGNMGREPFTPKRIMENKHTHRNYWRARESGLTMICNTNDLLRFAILPTLFGPLDTLNTSLNSSTLGLSNSVLRVWATIFDAPLRNATTQFDNTNIVAASASQAAKITQKCSQQFLL